MNGRGSSSASLAHTSLPCNRRRKPCKKRNCPDKDTHRHASTRPAVLFASFIEHSSVLDTKTDVRALQLPISDWSGAASDLRICICRVSYDTVVLTVVRAGRTLELPSSSTRETRHVHPPTCSILLSHTRHLPCLCFFVVLTAEVGLWEEGRTRRP
jgi:hypothetical protein